MTSHPPAVVTEQVLRRIYNEYVEMPGLQLTEPQARRLWGLDQRTCVQALEYLVAARFLVRVGANKYARLTEGAASFPRAPMAKAVEHPAPANSATGRRRSNRSGLRR